ncbi:MAG: alkaline phosphatase family protein [Promethearchaeota archaeon]
MNEKILIIGLDGCRPDALVAADTPNTDRLVERGAYSWNAQTEFHSVSGPAWTSLLTGVHTDKHRVTDNDFGPRDALYRTLFADATVWKPSLRAVAYSHWKPIITEIFEIGVLDERGSGSDARCARKLARSIASGGGDLFFLQLDDVDAAGHRHSYGPDSAGYIAAIEKADGLVGVVLDAVDGRPDDEDWQVFLVSDHGGSGKGHGKPVLDDLTIALVVAGGGTPPGFEIPGREDGAPMIVDVVPTAAQFLGMPGQPHWDGSCLVEGQQANDGTGGR